MFFLKAVHGLWAEPLDQPIVDLLEKPSLQGIDCNSNSQILMQIRVELSLNQGPIYLGQVLIKAVPLFSTFELILWLLVTEFPKKSEFCFTSQISRNFDNF